MIEEWKDIKGYEGVYQVSNMGNVRTLDHFIIDKSGRVQHIKARILKLHTYPNGYKDVMLQNNGVAKRHLVHKLVAIAFIPNPNNLPEINHKDESRDNNCANNLEWCTRKYNCNYGSYNAKRSRLAKGRVMSEEQKEKLSKALKGRPSPNKGNKLSDETKQHLRELMLGKKVSEETKYKMSEARKNYRKRRKQNEL